MNNISTTECQSIKQDKADRPICEKCSRVLCPSERGELGFRTKGDWCYHEVRYVQICDPCFEGAVIEFLETDNNLTLVAEYLLENGWLERYSLRTQIDCFINGQVGCKWGGDFVKYFLKLDINKNATLY